MGNLFSRPGAWCIGCAKMHAVDVLAHATKHERLVSCVHPTVCQHRSAVDKAFCFGALMPTRYLKPGIRDSEAIDSLSAMAECLYYRLLVTVDDFGRFDARPAMIRSQCFPIKKLSDEKAAELLSELVKNKLVIAYQVDGKPYLQVCKWDNKPRASESKFPPIPTDADNCMQTYTDADIPRTLLPVTVTVTGTGTKTETGNRKPETETRSARIRAASCPPDVSDQVWEDFTILRKTLRAPLTETAIDGIRREAGKAGVTLEIALKTCCERGWRGYRSDWVEKQVNGTPAPLGKSGMDTARNAASAAERIFGNAAN